MVKDIEIEGINIAFTIVLTTPACPMKELIKRNCEKAITDFVDRDAVVKVNMTATVTTQRTGNVLPNVKILLQLHQVKVV